MKGQVRGEKKFEKLLTLFDWSRSLIRKGSFLPDNHDPYRRLVLRPDPTRRHLGLRKTWTKGNEKVNHE